MALVAALPAIADDLGGVALLPWVITAFLATSAVAGIVAGPIIDGIGVRRTFRITGIWFLSSSAAAAVAPTMTLLVVARALQGIGGGLVISVALAVGRPDLPGTDSEPGHSPPTRWCGVSWASVGRSSPPVC